MQGERACKRKGDVLWYNKQTNQQTNTKLIITIKRRCWSRNDLCVEYLVAVCAWCYVINTKASVCCLSVTRWSNYTKRHVDLLQCSNVISELLTFELIRYVRIFQLHLLPSDYLPVCDCLFICLSVCATVSRTNCNHFTF